MKLCPCFRARPFYSHVLFLLVAASLSMGGASKSLGAEPAVSVRPEPAIAPASESLARPIFQREIHLDAIAQPDPGRNSGSQQKGRLKIGVGRRFPEPVRVSKALTQQAEWTLLPDGTRLWAVQVIADGARGLRLHLQNVRLPEGASTLVYSPGNAAPASVLLSAELEAERDAWMPTVHGEKLVFECRLPRGVDPGEAEFEIAEVSHLYETPADFMLKLGGCLQDVACYPEWEREASAVGRISFVENGDSYLCTASLLHSFDPVNTGRMLLTANHCVAWRIVASTVEVYWLYQSVSCGDFYTPIPSRGSFGTDLLAGSRESDFTLLRLRQAPPPGVYYLQWTPVLPQPEEAMVSIHHPSGREKSISLGSCVLNDTVWTKVRWSAGATQQGSSGAPLLNSQRQLVGQLYGGESSCVNRTGLDLYGRFDVTYPLIKQFLDPDNLSTNGSPVTVPPGNYYGVFQDEEASLSGSAGVMALTVGSRNLFSGSVRIMSWVRSFSGRLDYTGSTTIQIPRMMTPVRIHLSLEPGNTNRLSGYIEGGTWNAELALNRSVFDGITKVAAQAGAYNFFVQGKDPGTLPGYARCVVSPSGIAQMGVKTPGMPTWTKSVRMSAEGEVPVYTLLSAGEQLVVGKTFLNAGQLSESTGAWNWFKPGGVTNLTLQGTHYTAPPTNMPVFGSSNIVIDVECSALSSNLHFSADIGLKRKATLSNGARQQLTIQFGSSGVFSGSISGVSPSGPLPFSGILLQHPERGLGSFSVGRYRGVLRISGQM